MSTSEVPRRLAAGEIGLARIVASGSRQRLAAARSWRGSASTRASAGERPEPCSSASPASRAWVRASCRTAPQAKAARGPPGLRPPATGPPTPRRCPDRRRARRGPERLKASPLWKSATEGSSFSNASRMLRDRTNNQLLRKHGLATVSRSPMLFRLLVIPRRYSGMPGLSPASFAWSALGAAELGLCLCRVACFLCQQETED